jgi:hypothetical protein
MIMGLKILSAKKFNVNLKCSIHSTGKLGFTDSTIKALELTEKSCVKFAQDDEDEENLYLINSKETDEESFKVNKAGSYYYVNAKPLFDNLGLDYRKNTIIFDMVEVPELGVGIYKLNKRIKPRRKN